MSNNLPWSRRFRPQSFDDMVLGNPEVLGELKVASKKALAIILTGGFGVGKTTAARILSTEINGSQAGVIEEPSTDRGIAYIRALQERVRYEPPKKKWVVIIDEAHALTKDSFSALLKLLEDPPHSKVLFVLCTNQPHKIPKEIISRCRRIDLEPPSLDDGVYYLTGILKQVKFKSDKSIVHKLCIKALTDANFSMRQAVENLESMYDKIQSGTDPKKILSGKVKIENTGDKNIGDIEKVAGSILLAITREDAKATEAVSYILATMSHHDPINVVERMIGILYYGYIVDKGGKWNWQSKPYAPIFGNKKPSGSTVISLVNSLNTLLMTMKQTEHDVVPFAATTIAKLAITFRKK